MSNTAETCAKALVLLRSEPALKDLYDNVLTQAGHIGLLETVVTHLAEHGQTILASPAVNQSFASSASQPVAESTTSLTPSLALAESKGRTNRAARRRNARTAQSRQIQTDPKVVIPTRKRTATRQAHRGAQNRTVTASQALLWRDVTESTDESEGQVNNKRVDSPADGTSADELSQDTPKPARPRVAPKATLARTEQLQQIDWVFWIKADKVGYWRPLSHFPSTTQALFRRKFDADFLQKSYHVDYYARMLRNREDRVDRDQCVGNVTHANRNEASKWAMTSGDKENTCGTCFRAGRFCSRLVRVDGVVKLGFYPVPKSSRTNLTWKALHYWARKEEAKKK